MPATTGAPFAVAVGSTTSERLRLEFSGDLRFQACYRSWRRVRELAEEIRAGGLELDLTSVDRIDGGSAALLIELVAELRARGVEARTVGATGEVAALLELYGEHASRPSAKEPPQTIGLLSQVGAATAADLGHLRDVAEFVGRFALDSARGLRTSQVIPWRDVVRGFERHGADAVPIVVVINLLVGVILAFQAAGQLERFGAEVFVANLVGLSVVRELGPLMTAILLAGRSGAAFAAELGTMRVSEEVDALRTLGISPVAYLVLPRFLALLLALPLLTLLADAAGLLGGLAIGVSLLDLTVVGYWNQTTEAIGGWDVVTGLLKSVLFAATLATIACQRGLATHGGAEGVGRSTTSAVVTCIFALVLLDAALTWLFNLYGL